MLLPTLAILLVSVHFVSGAKHGHHKKVHHLSKHEIKHTQPRAMIWPKKLMPSLHRMLSHHHHHHTHHNMDMYGLNGNREADTMNLENRIQGMLGGPGGGGGDGGGLGTPNEFMGQEEFPDAAGRSTSDRYLVNKIMTSVNRESGDEANAFQDMMNELRMVKEAKEKKELLSTLGLNGLGFANSNQPPPMAEVSTLPPQENKFQGGKFEPPTNSFTSGPKFENLPQDLSQEQESQQLESNDEEEQMARSPYREEQPRFRDEQPHFDDQSPAQQDIGGNMEMRQMESGEEGRPLPQFNEVPPQQNEQDPVNIRGNFVRERWPEENPPESFPPEPVREMFPPRNPGPPMEGNEAREEQNMMEEGGNRWEQSPNIADRRMIFGGRRNGQSSYGQSIFHFNRPNIARQPQEMRESNIEAGPARVIDPTHPQEEFHRERQIPYSMPLPARRRQYPHEERAYTRTQTYSFMNTNPPQIQQQSLFPGRGLPFNGGRPFPPQSPDFMMESGGRGMPALRHSSFRPEQESNMFMRPDGRWLTGSDAEEEGNDIPAYRKTKVLKKHHIKYHNETIVDGTKFRELVRNKSHNRKNSSIVLNLKKGEASDKSVDKKKLNILKEVLINKNHSKEKTVQKNGAKETNEKESHHHFPKVQFNMKSKRKNSTSIIPPDKHKTLNDIKTLNLKTHN